MVRSLLFCLLLASPIVAQSPIAHMLCEPTRKMQQKLSRQLGETRRATGLRSPDQMMEVWKGAQGSWTLVLRYASGTSCIVAMGEHWEVAPENGQG